MTRALMNGDSGLWERVDLLGHRWDVARHPFYRRWANGDLHHGELVFYAGQYRHARRVVARLAQEAATMAPDLPLWDELELIADEKRRQVEMWGRSSTRSAATRPRLPRRRPAAASGCGRRRGVAACCPR